MINHIFILCFILNLHSLALTYGQEVVVPAKAEAKTILRGSVSLRRNNGETIPAARTVIAIVTLEEANKILEKLQPAAALIGQSKSLLKSNASTASKLDNIKALNRMTEALTASAGKPYASVITDSKGEFSISDIRSGSYGVLTSFSTETFVAYWVERSKVIQSVTNEITLTSKNAIFINQVE